jgi:hypothetical protein
LASNAGIGQADHAAHQMADQRDLLEAFRLYKANQIED